MVAELGNFALILALCLALAQGVLPLLGAALGEPRLMRTGRFLASGQFVFLAIAYAILTWAFLASDFSVDYVARHSNLTLPTLYRVTGVWSGHEGSMLLWVLILAGWGVAVALFSRSLPRAMLARYLKRIVANLNGSARTVSSPLDRSDRSDQTDDLVATQLQRDLPHRQRLEPQLRFLERGLEQLAEGRASRRDQSEREQRGSEEEQEVRRRLVNAAGDCAGCHAGPAGAFLAGGSRVARAPAQDGGGHA